MRREDLWLVDNMYLTMYIPKIFSGSLIYPHDWNVINDLLFFVCFFYATGLTISSKVEVGFGTPHLMYCKVTSTIKKSWLEASFRYYRLLWIVKFDVYILWTFKKMLISSLAIGVNAYDILRCLQRSAGTNHQSPHMFRWAWWVDGRGAFSLTTLTLFFLRHSSIFSMAL